MTQKKKYSLRITMENFAGTVKTANYATFKLTENVNISLKLFFLISIRNEIGSYIK